MSSATLKLPDVGDKAPDFSALDDRGQVRRLADFKGKTVILYFYPKDNTSGCTQEACDFRDLQPRFSKKSAVVLGVSPDSAKSHAGFKTKQNLNFTLLADEDKKICSAYGVWKEKSMYGRKYMGVERSTFVIGPDGRIKEAQRKVKAAGHAQAILETL